MEDVVHCLSCLNVVAKPLFLTCGHSVCSGCHERHADQTHNNEAGVLCELCTEFTQMKKIRNCAVLEKLIVNTQAMIKVGKSMNHKRIVSDEINREEFNHD